VARHWFGGGPADWGFQTADNVDGVDNLVQLAGGTTVTFWNSESGGTQYTDLLVDGDPADQVVTDDGSGGREVGSIPPFRGPDGITRMWADGGAGARYVMSAWDLGDRVSDIAETANENASELATHLGSTNPHSIRVRDLDDVDTTATAQVTDGQVIGWDANANRWLPISVEGISGVVTIAGEQTITGKKVFENPDGVGEELDASAIEIRALSGQYADVFVCRNPNGQRVGYFNEHGELRVIASQPTTVAVRIKQRDGTHSVNLTEWTTIDYPGPGDILARVDAQGRMRGANTMVAPWLMSVPGSLSTGPGAARIYNDLDVSLTIRSVRASVGTSPDGDDIIVDVKRNGVSIFASSGDQPTIPDGEQTSGRVTNLETVNLNPGDHLTVDIDQVGSSTPGADLVVQITIN